MKNARFVFAAFVFAFAFTAAMAAPAVAAQALKPEPLVVISIDGMKPEYVTHAVDHGLKLPELTGFLAEGTYAEGVRGVLPTVTYPSHTTLVTGVWPAEHGIVNNTTFDPYNEHPGQWYWDFRYIKVETLYQAADKAGLKTAAVGWPVTVGAPIDYLIAEGAQSEKTDQFTGSPYNPPNILEQLGFKPTNDFNDAAKTDEAIAILRKWHPALLLVHLTDLDHEEHLHGPFSPQADATIETIDGQVREIADAADAVNPHARIVIVSDHGFVAISHNVNLNVLFGRANLIQLGPPKDGRLTIKSWEAEAWHAGGTAAIVLHHPHDKDELRKVKAVLDAAQADPAYGIATVLDHDQIAAGGGFPTASFLVEFKPGFNIGVALTGPVVTPSTQKGTHGYLPSRPEMRSTFMAEGYQIAHGRDLGVIDMRQIAPTLAEMLGVTLPAAKLPPVNIAK